MRTLLTFLVSTFRHLVTYRDYDRTTFNAKLDQLLPADQRRQRPIGWPTEGHIKRQGVNPPPRTPKPLNFQPPGQGVRS